MAFTVTIESPLQDDVRGLIDALNAHLSSITPTEFVVPLKPEELIGNETTVYVARDDNKRAIGMGALRLHAGDVGEVRRIYTLPEVRGQGVGKAIMANIVRLAEASKLKELVLETGGHNPDARALYERAGFSRCGPVLDYPASQYSVFYRRPLGGAQ